MTLLSSKGRKNSLKDLKRFSAGGKQNVNLCKYKR